MHSQEFRRNERAGKDYSLRDGAGRCSRSTTPLRREARRSEHALAPNAKTGVKIASG